MIADAKNYYRKLDTFLSEIYHIGEGNVLSTVLKELVNDLGKELLIQNGRLYELQDEKYVLIGKVNIDSTKEEENELPLLDPAVSLLLSHGCYIFNNPDEQLKLQKEDSGTLVGFSVQREEEIWLLIFEVQQGWDREEIEFSFNTIKKVLHARISSEYFTSSLNQARLIQRSLLPKNSPKIDGFDIFGKSISTDIVGGDMYDYMDFSDGHFGIAIGDASGHGLPAALLVRDVVTGLRMGLEKEMKITPVLEKLNSVIHRSTLSTSFTSFRVSIKGLISCSKNLLTISLNASLPIFPLIGHYSEYQNARSSYQSAKINSENLKDNIKLKAKSNVLLLLSGAQKIKASELSFKYANETYNKMIEQILNTVALYGNVVFSKS